MAREPRATFGPVVLLGLAAAALTAIAGAKVWVVETSSGSTLAGQSRLLGGTQPGEMPLAAALAYLLLATWGIVLVTRGRVRRALACFGVLLSLGYAACVVTGAMTLPQGIRDRYASLVASGQQVPTGFTGWFWAAAVAAVLSIAATVLAVRLAPGWPEMGSRYDAPGSGRASSGAGTPGPDVDDPEAGNRELWKAIDEGHDPTD